MEFFSFLFHYTDAYYPWQIFLSATASEAKSFPNFNVFLSRISFVGTCK